MKKNKNYYGCLIIEQHYPTSNIYQIITILDLKRIKHEDLELISFPKTFSNDQILPVIEFKARKAGIRLLHLFRLPDTNDTMVFKSNCYK